MAKVTIADERLKPGDICVVSGERHVCTVAGQIGPIDLPPGEHRYCIDDRRNGSVTVRDAVSLPAPVSLESRVAALEARLDALEGGRMAEPPPALATLRNEGESLADFRQRMRTWRAGLHSKMMGAREGVGEFSDDERRWLVYLEGVDWLGS